MSNKREIDYLTEDAPIPNQKWVCISFLSPEGIKNTTMRGLKVRGVFSDYEAATAHAANLQKSDPAFHVFVGEVGKWLPWDPNPDDEQFSGKQQYYEEELQSLMETYRTNQMEAKQLEQRRRDAMLEDSIRERADRNNYEKNRARLRKKLDEKLMLEERENIAKKEKERLSENARKIREAEDTTKQMDQNMKKLKEIYKKIQNKQ